MRILPRKERENNRDYALRNLRENIIHLDLPPGSRISENDLSAQLGLSRTPVREALMELARVRLVEVYPQRGSAVSLIDYEMVEEACFMRRVLECAVVKEVCKMITPEERVELEDKAYENEEYALFFSNFRTTAATIQFYRLLKEKMSVYAAATKVNASRMARMTICEADANTIDYPILTGKYAG
jgi:DNA-binding FadR family transcriptional regulator